MIVGVPAEVKDNENRISMVPAGVDALCKRGHTVLVEADGGVGSGISNEEFRLAGAELVDSHAEVFERADMIVKVKEPLPSEYDLIREGQTVYTYFHFAADRTLTEAMVARGAVCIAYETVEDSRGRLPLLTPMSEVAGRMSVQQGAKYLEKPQGGRGVLLGGIPGVARGKVVVLGGGVVGIHAAQMACGLGADVTILDLDLERLRYLDEVMPKNCRTLFSNDYVIREQIRDADLVIGAVLVKGAKAPYLIRHGDLSAMQPGSVIVDVSVDQGGCVETTRPTKHSDPVYTVDGVVHYCVANIPGAVGRTSTYGLTNATLRHGLQLADLGWREALKQDAGLRLGANVVNGHVTYKGVSDAFDMEYVSIDELL